MIKLHKKISDLTKVPHYTVKGVMAKNRTSKSGELLEPVRKFIYGKGEVALNLRVMVTEKVDGIKAEIPVDIVCFQDSEFEGILELNLQEDDRVSVFTRQSPKGLCVDKCDWVTRPKSI